MNFKNFFKVPTNIISENMPVLADYEAWGSSLRTNIERRAQDNDTYLFKSISSALQISVADAVDLIKQKLYDVLFPGGQQNPAETEEEYRELIGNALEQIIRDIEREHLVRIKTSQSIKDWTSRIISNLATSQKAFNGENRPRAVRQQRVRRAIDQAGDAIINTEPQLTDIQKLIKKTTISGASDVDYKSALTPETSRSIFGVDITSITNESMLFLYKSIQKFFIQRNFRQLTLFLDNFLPKGPLIDDNYGVANNRVHIVPQRALYFVFSYQFANNNNLIPNVILKRLANIATTYNVSYENNNMYIHYINPNWRKEMRVCYTFVGTCSNGRKALYVEEHINKEGKKILKTPGWITNGIARVRYSRLQYETRSRYYILGV